MSVVKELIIEEDLTELLAFDERALHWRFMDRARQRRGDEALGDGVIRLVIRDPRLVNFGKLNIDDNIVGPLGNCNSLILVDLSGCLSLTTLGDSLFNGCKFLQQVILPDSIRSLGDVVFSWCVALTSLVLPARVETIGKCTFDSCKALTSVSLPASLRNVEDRCFYGCSKLAKVVLSAPVTFHEFAFVDCTRMIELADAAGFPSTWNWTCTYDGPIFPMGDGVSTFLIDRHQCKLRIRYILVAFSRFNFIVDNFPGTEVTKVAVAISYSPKPSSCFDLDAGLFFNAMNQGGGTKGVLGEIFDFLFLPR